MQNGLFAKVVAKLTGNVDLRGNLGEMISILRTRNVMSSLAPYPWIGLFVFCLGGALEAYNHNGQLFVWGGGAVFFAHWLSYAFHSVVDRDGLRTEEQLTRARILALAEARAKAGQLTDTDMETILNPNSASALPNSTSSNAAPSEGLER